MDYRSKATFFGLPLLHVTAGLDPQTGRERVARGIIAIGGRAQGVLAMGGMAVGGVAIGGVAVGLFALGGGAFGVISVGGLAIALLFGIGGGVVAPIALGGGALGYYAFGAKGFGAHVADAFGRDSAAENFFRFWARPLLNALPLGMMGFMAVFLPLMIGLPIWLSRKRVAPPVGPIPGARASGGSFGRMLVWVILAVFAGILFMVGLGVFMTLEAIRRPALQRSRESAGAVHTPSPTQLPALGSARELILPSPRQRHAEMWDLDSGRWATNNVFGENDRETHAWVRSTGGDLLGVLERGQCAVLGMDLAAVPLASNCWETITAEAVRNNAQLPQLEPNKITGLSALEDKTDTWLFRTRENGLGVLQLLGPSQDPAGVRIRYRLLESTAGSGPRLTLEQLPREMQDRAIVLFNDIEDFGHEFDAAFTAKNVVAAQTGTRRLLNLLSNFNAVAQGTDCEFPSTLFAAVGKVKAELDAGDLEAARRASQHDAVFAAEFRRIGARVVALARDHAKPPQVGSLLELRRVLEPGDTNSLADQAPSPHGGPPLRVEKLVLLGDTALQKAELSWNEISKHWEINLSFTPAGTRQFAEVTRTNLNRQLAIVFNGRVLSAPVIRSEITGGKGVISGSFGFAEAVDIVWRLNRACGRLHAPPLGRNDIRLQCQAEVPLSGQNSLLDLDHERAIAPPPEFADWNTSRIDSWLGESGVDIGLQPGPSLAVLAPSLEPFSPDLWPRVPARSELLQQLESRVGAGTRAAVRLDRLASPAVFAYCTAEGSVGLFHVRWSGAGTNVTEITVNVRRSEQ